MVLRLRGLRRGLLRVQFEKKEKLLESSWRWDMILIL